MLGFCRGLSTSAKNDGSISSRAALFINECQKDETKEEKKETTYSASVAEDFKTKKPKQMKEKKKKKIKIQPFCGETRPML